MKNWLLRKDPDVEKRLKLREERDDRGWMVGWHHWLNAREFEQALAVGDGQGNLACCSPWGHKELDMNEWLNWTDSLQLEKKMATQLIILAWEIPWAEKPGRLQSMGLQRVRYDFTMGHTHTHTPSLFYSSNFSLLHLSDFWPLPPHHDLVGIASPASPSR